MEDSEPAPPLVAYALGPVGSGSAVWSEVRDAVRGQLQLRPIRLPGREGRFTETALTTVRAQADDILARTGLGAGGGAGCWLVGVCSGAVTCYEVVVQLALAGLAQPDVLVVVSQGAPGATPLAPPWAGLGGDSFRERVLAELWLPDEVRADDAALELIEPLVRADVTALESYRPPPAPAVDCDVVALCGRDDDLAGSPGLAAWAGCTRGRFTVLELDAGHHMLMSAPQTLAAALRELADPATVDQTGSG